MEFVLCDIGKRTSSVEPSVNTDTKKFLIVNATDSKGENNRRLNNKVKLDNDEFIRFEKLHLDALKYNVMDSTNGIDGSSWCLQTKRGGTYLFGCFYSPDFDKEARGLIGLSKLGREL